MRGRALLLLALAAGVLLLGFAGDEPPPEHHPAPRGAGVDWSLWPEAGLEDCNLWGTCVGGIRPGDFRWSYLHIVEGPATREHLRDHDLVRVHADNGESVTFSSVARNAGWAPSLPFVTYLQILDQDGRPVDIQHWAPFRAQHVPPLPSGGYAIQNWTVRMAEPGDYVLYVFGLEYEAFLNETVAQPYSSPALHLHVAPRPELEPAVALPVAIGVPAAIGAGLWAARRRP